MKLETRTNYRKPRVNSLAIGVKDYRNRKNRTNYKERRDHYTQNKEEQKKARNREGNRYPCRVCKEYTHKILHEMPRILRFIPGEPEGLESPPGEVASYA